MTLSRRRMVAALAGAGVSAALGGCARRRPRRPGAPPPGPSHPPAPGAPPAPPPIEPVFARAITFFGGRLADPHTFAPTVAGFQDYLDVTGITHFTAHELTTPHQPGVAARFGYSVLLPRRAWWPRGAALALLGEDLRRASGRALWVRNWWRPAGYNEAVGGEPHGDHPTAHAMDFDYHSPVRRYLAERRLMELFYGAPWLELSLGLGRMSTHVGIDSPRGCRVWYYAGHPDHSGRTWGIEASALSCHRPRAARLARPT